VNEPKLQNVQDYVITMINQGTTTAVSEVAAQDSWWWSWFSWRPTSFQLLEVAEKKMLEGVRRSFKSYFVPISDDNKIQTIETESEEDRLPVLLLHGFAAGVGFWTLNLDEISQKQKVYAIDLLGFGRSSRPNFPSDSADAEKFYVQSIEEWRQKAGLEQFVLLGHSFGGYLACSYTLEHPERVRHLILADPWGIPEKPPPGEEESFKLPRWAKAAAAVLSLFNPLAALRVAGPWGPTLISKFRPDLRKKYEGIFGEDDTRVMEYIYHCNAQSPSGETAFRSLSIPYGWAKYPMIHRVKEIDSKIPMTVLYGSRSWMDSSSGYNIKYLRDKSYVDVQIIKGAGHHIYADRPDEFNMCVNNICDKVTEQSDLSNLAQHFMADDIEAPSSQSGES